MIEIGGYESEAGSGVLDISCGGPVIPGSADLGDAPDSSNNSGSLPEVTSRKNTAFAKL
jgi:hypothetical protein